MPTPRGTILGALHTLLSALPATALCGDVLPERVPAAGLLILRSGKLVPSVAVRARPASGKPPASPRQRWA